MAYRMLLPMVDVIFADVAQPDQARIVGINARLFLKQGGGLLISIKASCIDSTGKYSMHVRLVGACLHCSSAPRAGLCQRSPEAPRGQVLPQGAAYSGYVDRTPDTLGIVTDTTTEPYERDHAMVSCVYQQKEFEAN